MRYVIRESNPPLYLYHPIFARVNRLLYRWLVGETLEYLVLVVIPSLLVCLIPLNLLLDLLD